MPRDNAFEPEHDDNERLVAAMLADPTFRTALAALIEATLRIKLGADATCTTIDEEP
jgi:hypothetical protein